MATTTRSSERASRWSESSPRGPLLVASACLGVTGLSLLGCAGSPGAPTDAFQVSEESQRQKAAQVRYFETDDEADLLSASAAALQDMGFHIDESVRELGFLNAAKERSAREYGQEIRRCVTSALLLGMARNSVDLQQKFAASLVTRPVRADGSRHEVRITFYRTIWSGDGYFGRETILPGAARAEVLRDPVLYQEFFAKLSKSVFLEAYTL